MWIVELKQNPNGSHNDHRADHITVPPDGWAVIPDGFEVPASFPFVGIKAQEMNCGESGCSVLTVTKMTEGVLPEFEPAEETPTQLDVIEAQVTYTALMTDTLLEV